jgi:hypothetical protein
MMKKFIFAAIAALGLASGSVFAAPAQHQNSGWGQGTYPSANFGGDGGAGG